ncbi:MalY/PatB family protein [Bifidobacterium scaligerum]|uniref:cysteine-S-conjugate beta-lyase n=1 Tax=Bifidobacterium scaligerum TaxID=2052656 RepID=A0A2M9HTK4_9BIFI|nr:MalY/PatB family protein [Bifidobacterium scaligerum]PJM80141.1 pyridoxal phosphate-dependent aminotransferase [Bifidobacterium scaligerum]
MQQSRYDFDSILERHGSTSIKWHEIEEMMGPNSRDVIPLSVADMEFKPAPEIVSALVEAATHDVFGYDYAPDEYFEAVTGWMRRRHNFDVNPAWISLSDGVMPAVNTALRAVTRPGDKVIIQRPVYYPFTFAAEHNGLTILDNELVLDEAAGRYAIDFDDLEAKAADPRCTAMMLCNPHNPVGRVWSERELRCIGDICLKHGVYLLCDEIHADFAYPGHPVTMFGTLGERYHSHLFEFTAPTKTFNLAGLLCSNVIIPDPSLKRRFDVAAENIAGLTVSHFGLVACQAAYNDAEDWLNELMTVLERNLSCVRDFAARVDGVRLIEPEGTYLAWLDCRGLGFETPDALRDFMRLKARVWFDEGSLFGHSGDYFERINLACPTALLQRVLNNMESALAGRQ